MTKIETMKALILCMNNDICPSECPLHYINIAGGCGRILKKSMYDIFIQQEEETDRIREECGKQSILWSKHYESLFETSKKTIREEALKEFADKLQDRCNAQEGRIYASDIGAVLNEMIGEYNDAGAEEEV